MFFKKQYWSSGFDKKLWIFWWNINGWRKSVFNRKVFWNRNEARWFSDPVSEVLAWESNPVLLLLALSEVKKWTSIQAWKGSRIRNNSGGRNILSLGGWKRVKILQKTLKISLAFRFDCTIAWLARSQWFIVRSERSTVLLFNSPGSTVLLPDSPGLQLFLQLLTIPLALPHIWHILTAKLSTLLSIKSWASFSINSVSWGESPSKIHLLPQNYHITVIGKCQKSKGGKKCLRRYQSTTVGVGQSFDYMWNRRTLWCAIRFHDEITIRRYVIFRIHY